MAKKDAATLRAARQQRIASQQSQGQSQSYSTPTPAPAAAPVGTAASTPRELTAQVLNPAEISKSANLDMTLYGEDTSDPHWMITANGKPVAEVRLSDQENPAQNATMFVTANYARHLIEAAKHVELPEMLASIKARPYIASIAGSDAYKALEERTEAIAKAAYAKKAANLRGDLLNTLGFVVQAQAKNFISENVLKDTLFKRMAEAGIEEDRSIAIIEAAWQESSAQYFEACFAQAQKWMDLTPEAYAELVEQVGNMPSRMPVVASTDVIPNARRVPSAEHNVPFTTYTASAQPAESAQDPKAQLKETLSLRGRRLAHTMTSK